MNADLSHAALVTRAHKVRAAAADRDIDRLNREVGALLDAFVEHTAAERGELLTMPSFNARLVRRGQERLLDELIELSVELVEGDGTCRCEQLGRDISLRLALQADAERRALTERR